MTTSSTKLTVGQQGVIHAYDVDIAHYKAQLSDTINRYLNADIGDSEYSTWNRHYTENIEKLEAERAETLAAFEAENAPVAVPATEPQTPAFQAAVDNVWFENTRNASSIKSSWNFDLWNTRMDRLDYVTDLEEKIMRALNVLDLAYELSS